MKVQCIGNPFPFQTSSCSTKKPTLFEWTQDSSNFRVFIDHAIPQTPANLPGKTFAWICESNAVVSSIRDFCVNNVSFLKERFLRVFTCDKSLVSLDPIFTFIQSGSNLPWVAITEGEVEKTKNISMFCSGKSYSEGHKARIAFANAIRDTVDLYGSIPGAKYLGHNGTPWPDKSDGLLPYRYSVVMENAYYSDYFTEKLTDCFATLTMPIYKGCPDVANYFNPKGMLFLDETKDFSVLTKEFYEVRLPFIKENREIVRNMKSADDQLYMKMFSK